MPEDVHLRLVNAGRCRILERLGEGGMGTVYKGHHRDLDLDVAIKFLHLQLLDRPEASGRFFREARLAARINDPGIVRVFDCGNTDGHYYIVMEFVDGQSLAEHIEERGSLPVARA